MGKGGVLSRLNESEKVSLELSAQTTLFFFWFYKILILHMRDAVSKVSEN